MPNHRLPFGWGRLEVLVLADISILGWGSAVPDRLVENAELEAEMGLSEGWIFRRTGIKSRRFVAEHEGVSSLALPAAREALARAGIQPDMVRLFILATSTPDYPLPPTAPDVAAHLGISAAAFDLAGACSGFLFGLAQAHAFVAMHGGYAVVVGANVLSKRLNFKEPAGAVLFGDGAGAVVLGPDPLARESVGLLAFDAGCAREERGGVKVPKGGSRAPVDAGTFVKGEHLMNMRGGLSLFRQAVEGMAVRAEHVLASRGFGVSDLDLWLPHQANQRMIDEVGRRLSIPVEKAVSIVGDVGNTSAAGIPLALAEAAQAGRLKRGDLLLMNAAATGFSSVAMLWRF